MTLSIPSYKGIYKIVGEVSLLVTKFKDFNQQENKTISFSASNMPVVSEPYGGGKCIVHSWNGSSYDSLVTSWEYDYVYQNVYGKKRK